MLLNPNFLPEHDKSQVDLSPVVDAIKQLGAKIDSIELPEAKEPKEEVSVSNLDEVKLHLRNELSKALKPVLSRLEAIKIPEPKEFPTEIKVSNLEPQIAPFEAVRVTNLDELKESIQSLYNAILGISISVPAPSIDIPAPQVNVVPPEIDTSKIIDALDPLKYLSDRPNKPIAVRMSDGHKFMKIIQELKKSTDELGQSTEKLGVVYAGSSGMSVDEFKAATISINNNSLKQAVEIQESAPYTYVAYAPPGSSLASAVWQAFRLDETSGLKLQWADGNTNYDNVATTLSALTYS